MKKYILCALLCTFTAPAMAESAYVGVKLGSVNYDYSNIANNSQSGFGILAGFPVDRNIAVEFEYNDLGGFDSPNRIVTGHAFGMGVTGSAQLNPQFSLFAKIGLASTTLNNVDKAGIISDYTYSNTGLNVGFGGQFNLSRTVGIRAGLDRFRVGNSISQIGIAQMVYIGSVFNF